MFYFFCHILILCPNFMFIDPPRCDKLVDLCFIVDSSGSIRDSNLDFDHWQLQLNFIIDLVDVFDIAPDASRVGLVVFSDDAQLVFSLDTYTNVESLKAAILNTPYLSKTTNTAEAFRVTREQCFNVVRGDRLGIQNLAILISDGHPFPEEKKHPTIEEAQLLKDSGTYLIAVGITNGVDLEFLKKVSSSPQIQGESYFRVPDFSALGATVRSVAEAACEAITGISIYI